MGRKGIPGISFSWKRASGVSAAKGKLSRELRIPLTKGGRQQKVGRAMGCCVPAAVMLLGMMTVAGGALFATSKAIAHGGGLNAEGCHNNRKTGDYHCHRAPTPPPPPQPANSFQAGGTVYYANCSAARAAGAAPVYRGDPGYGAHLDRDNDGVGCE